MCAEAEVIAAGLRKGAAGTWPPQGSTEALPGFPFYGPIPDTWDNVHWWGGYKDYHIPSAPGAFHAAHLHWRWGLVQQTEALPIGAMGSEQFKGSYLGGPLLDPLIPDQDIWAVILREGQVEGLASDFKAQVKALREFPDPIADGSDIELWMVCKAHVNGGELPTMGSFFIHGLFFAHDPEPEYWTQPLSRTFQSGTRAREYSNPDHPDTKKWERDPEP